MAIPAPALIPLKPRVGSLTPSASQPESSSLLAEQSSLPRKPSMLPWIIGTASTVAVVSGSLFIFGGALTGPLLEISAGAGLLSFAMLGNRHFSLTSQWKEELQAAKISRHFSKRAQLQASEPKALNLSSSLEEERSFEQAHQRLTARMTGSFPEFERLTTEAKARSFQSDDLEPPKAPKRRAKL